MSSIPSTSAAREIVSGLSGFDEATEAGVCTVGPMALAGTPWASKSAVTWVGVFTWPGATRANSSSRLWGFCDRPHDSAGRAVLVPEVTDRQVERRAATPFVTATSSGPFG